MSLRCYCCSDQAYEACCKPFIYGEKPVESCEQLMRSRYSAYCIKHAEYIYRTEHPDKRQNDTLDTITDFATHCHFLRLQVTETTEDSNSGTVLFTADYLCQQQRYSFTERSYFSRLSGQWLYIEGSVTEHKPEKPGRNDPCPCLSGKKVKHCQQHRLSGN